MQTLGLSIFTAGKTVPARAETGIKQVLRLTGLRELAGPEAVEKNLIKGLKKIPAEFNLNPALKNLHPWVCVLRDARAVSWLFEHREQVKFFALGPNFTAAEMVQLNGQYGDFINVILAPSDAVKFTYVRHGLPERKIAIWPVGIDTEEFSDVSERAKRHDALLYFKRRKTSELNQAIKLLKDLGQTFKLLSYGKYSQSNFKRALADCRYAVVLDGHESQGIALQEIMSSNLPLFVFDQTFVGESPDPYLRENLRVSSVPYWSEICGVKVATDSFAQSIQPYITIPEAQEQFKNFLAKPSFFKPRQYILDNLELKMQAEKFLQIFS